jgi:hypothetical protein
MSDSLEVSLISPFARTVGMYYDLVAGSRLYRVTGAGVNWPVPLHGIGAYMTKGGRYNDVHQATVYCAEDPIAVIAETAFYDALEWQQKMSGYRLNPIIYPFLTITRFIIKLPQRSKLDFHKEELKQRISQDFLGVT